MQPVVRSVNVGGPRGGILPKGRDTAIDKRPVEAIEVRDPGPKRGGLGSGVVGDDVVSRKHHGGSYQAVCAVAREELDWWGGELGRDLRDGMFGENLTTVEVDVDGAVMGVRWRVGSAVLEVAGPRIPCATFGAWMGERGWVRRFTERGWVRRFTERGRTGAYPAVVEPGVVSVGDVVEVSGRPAHGITVPGCSGRSPVTARPLGGCWRPGSWTTSSTGRWRAAPLAVQRSTNRSRQVRRARTQVDQ